MNSSVQNRLLNRSYYKWLVFIIAATGTFMGTMTASIVSVGLPPITAALQTDIATAQWVVTAYLLVITSLLPLMGRLGDIFGRRRMYSFGFAGFTAGSLLCGVAGSISLLIGFRVLQAIGISALMANAMALVTSNFPRSERGKALGMIGTIVALGSLSGPGLGGVLIEHFGWHSIFFVNLPIGLIGYAGAKLILPCDHDRQQEKIDYFGAALFMTGMASFLLVLSYGTQWGWTSVTTLACLAFALLVLSAFIWYEQQIDYPMLELSIFKNWGFTAGNLAGFLSFVATFINTMLLPFFLYDVLAFSPAKTGLVMSAFPLVMAITAPVSGAFSDKVGFVTLTTVGLGLMSLGLVLTANLYQDAALWLIVGAQALMGLGNGLFQSPNNNSVMSSVPSSQLGVAGGINALSRNFGMICGAALSVSILEYRRAISLSSISQPTAGQQAAAFMTGYHEAMLVGACLAALGMLISLKRSGSRQNLNSD